MLNTTIYRDNDGIIHFRADSDDFIVIHSTCSKGYEITTVVSTLEYKSSFEPWDNVICPILSKHRNELKIGE